MQALLEARGLIYSYDGHDGSAPLCGVDFSLYEGENLALIGANGSGKTTLLQILVGVLEPHSGQLLFGGKPVSKRDLPVIRQKVGLVFQNPEHQLFCNTVYEDIVFGPLNMGLSKAEADSRAESALSVFGISHIANRAPYRLSDGEKRLAAIASVISMRPDILLMDEPSSGLDPRARRELIGLLNRLPQAKIITTHDLDFAVRTCGRAMILHNGKIAVTGEPDRLLRDDTLLQSLGL